MSNSPKSTTKSEQNSKREAAIASGLNRAARRALGMQAAAAPAPATSPAKPAEPVPSHRPRADIWRVDDIALRPCEVAEKPAAFKKA